MTHIRQKIWPNGCLWICHLTLHLLVPGHSFGQNTFVRVLWNYYSTLPWHSYPWCLQYIGYPCFTIYPLWEPPLSPTVTARVLWVKVSHCIGWVSGRVGGKSSFAWMSYLITHPKYVICKISVHNLSKVSSANCLRWDVKNILLDAREIPKDMRTPHWGIGYILPWGMGREYNPRFTNKYESRGIPSYPLNPSGYPLPHWGIGHPSSGKEEWSNFKVPSKYEAVR